MSNSPSSKETVQKPDSDATNQKEEEEFNAVKIQECEKHLKYVDAEVLVIIEDLMKKHGQPFTDLLKNLLECSVCKEVMHLAVSRQQCLHTFCMDCISQWVVSSNECPICRDDIVLHVKNPIIDQIVNLLVDFSFSEKEKEERSNEIQHLSGSAVRSKPHHFKAMDENLQGEPTVMKKMNPEKSLPGRMACATMIHSLLCEIWTDFELDNVNDTSSIPGALLGLHVKMYNLDWDYLNLVYHSIPSAVLRATMFE